MNALEQTDQKLAQVYPDLATRWRKAAQSFFELHKMEPKIVDGLRSFETQFGYWKIGRKLVDGKWTIVGKVVDGKWTIVGKVVTHALPALSFHPYGLAIDSAFSGPDPYLEKMAPEKAQFYWNEYGRFVKAFGMVWGGDWEGAKKDQAHCQMSYTLSIHDVQVLYEYGGLKAVWNKCDQIINGVK